MTEQQQDKSVSQNKEIIQFQKITRKFGFMKYQDILESRNYEMTQYDEITR